MKVVITIEDRTDGGVQILVDATPAEGKDSRALAFAVKLLQIAQSVEHPEQLELDI